VHNGEHKQRVIVNSLGFMTNYSFVLRDEKLSVDGKLAATTKNSIMDDDQPGGW
jgi:hypothetical protein